MPRKEFESFTRLDASDVNTYLMDQSVMTFAGTAARGSAITTPVEGMVTYLEDSNSLQLYGADGWTAAGGVSSGNAIINGAFEINQRGFTSSTATNTYMFDRWRTTLGGASGTATYSAQTFPANDAPLDSAEQTNFLRVVTTGQTNTNSFANFLTFIENVRTLAGERVTLSFYAKAATGTPKIFAEIDQNFGSGGSTRVLTPVSSFTLSDSWERFNFTVTLPSVDGKTIGASNFLSANFWVSAGSDFNSRTNSLGIQSNTFDIWGVQLEAGPVATPFRRNANSLQGELAACQRYFFVLTPPTTGYTKLASGYVQNANIVQACGPISHPVTMRAAPTVTFTFTSNNISSYDGAEGDVTGFRDASPFVSLDRTTFNVTTSGMTTNRAAHILHRAGNMSFASEL
jgi:hypothetical protein